MTTLGSAHRILRPDASTVTYGPPQCRSGRLGPSHASHGNSGIPRTSRQLVLCNYQQYGRGQPPNQPQQPMALVRRPAYETLQPAQPVVLNLSQIMGKQLITRNKGSKLGVMGEAWVDVIRMEVTGFDLEISKGKNSTLPLYTLKEVGDVALVQDDSALRQYANNYNCVQLLGAEVRARDGRVVGKIRDLAFSPDSGMITKFVYDDFGLRFLPLDFFDTYSVSVEYVEWAREGYLVVSSPDMAPQQESLGVLNNFLRKLASRPATAGLLSDGRSDSALMLQAYTQEQGYTMQEWKQRIAEWEARSGIKYEEYMQQQEDKERQRLYGGYSVGARFALQPGQQQPQQQPGSRFALPPAASATGRQARPMPPQQQQQQQPQPQQVLQPQTQPPQQRQQQPQQYGAPGQQYGGAGYGNMDPRFRGTPAPQAQGPATRYPGTAPAQQPPQQQWPQQPQQQQAPQAGGAGPQQWPQQPQQGPYPPQQRPVQPQQQPGMVARGAPVGVPPGQGAVPQGSGAPGGPAQGPHSQYGAWQGQGAQLQGMAQGPPSGGIPGGPVPGAGRGVLQQQQGAAAAAQNGEGPAGGGGSALRVEEWLAREVQSSDPALEMLGRGPGAPQQQQAMMPEANGWDGKGAGPGQRVY